jgi:predicted Ser/Thr protein kinase
MIESGTTLQKRYRIDRQIGQGGMGAVYIATDQRFGSTVAIKETLYMDDNFRKAIEREARLLNSLKHSALPRVSDHFEEDNGQFLVMEYIPGDDVGSMLDPEHPRFTLEQILKWADQLLDALDYLHNQVMPVIHRDIKPQNLKITPRGDMILLDFGLAKGNPTDAGHVTAAKSIFGYSRNYASLEQIQGTGTDPRSDLYSLAATLYHLLTNTPPEDALTRAMAVLSNKPDPLRPANLIDPTIPRGVAGVLQKAMALNADERPETAAEMREMLRENEKYGYLADAATFAHGAGKTEAFGHDTEIMPQGGTRLATKRGEAKTEVLPTDFGEKTAVRPAAAPASETQVDLAGFTSIQPAKRRGRMMAAAALVLVAVCAAVGGGLYFGKPYFTTPAASTTQTEQQPVQPQAQLPAASDANTQASSQASGVETSVPANSANAETAKQQTKTDKTKAQHSDPNAGGEGDTSSDEGDMSDIPEVDVREVPGGVDIVKTQNGKTTVTHVETLPKNFNPIPPDVERMLQNLDTSKMTPQQRANLQRMIQRQKQQRLRRQQQRQQQNMQHPQTPDPPEKHPEQ